MVLLQILRAGRSYSAKYFGEGELIEGINCKDKLYFLFEIYDDRKQKCSLKPPGLIYEHT